MEMPRWSDSNKESVGAYAIALRHQLGYYMQHQVKVGVNRKQSQWTWKRMKYIYAKRYDEDMETSGPDKKESEEMPNAD
jgi:hypothetical protein